MGAWGYRGLGDGFGRPLFRGPRLNAGWLLSTWLALASMAGAGERPNILLILADNWRWPHASVLGDPLARTPAFDRVAREGVLFTHAFNPVPSCSPTRSCILTGKAAHQLGSRANLWSDFPRDTPVVTELLRRAGYETGYSGKGWGPGNHQVSGWAENPVGRKYSGFGDFAARRDRSKPFFFWLGNTDTATRGGLLPHFDQARTWIDPGQVVVPPELPDCEEVRKDLINYYGGVAKMDAEAAEAIEALRSSGLLENTVVIYTSDNGWQMPRGLANCYDSGSRVPLAVRWGACLEGGRKVEPFVNIGDIGPTILELAGLEIPAEMTMRSFVGMLKGEGQVPDRDAVFIERERHANVRRGNLSYPVRAVRTANFLYLRNYRPLRWPAGDPDVFFVHERPFGDVDTTLVKDYLLARRDDPAQAARFSLIFGKRPAEEFYDLRVDPEQLDNVAKDPRYVAELERHRKSLEAWMRATDDPRLDPNDDRWDGYEYYGQPSKSRK